MARRRRQGLGATEAYHAERQRDSTEAAKMWIKGALRDARAGKCHAALASAENALIFAAQAQAHHVSERVGAEGPTRAGTVRAVLGTHRLPIFKRASRVNATVVKHCLAIRGHGPKGAQGRLLGASRKRGR